MRTKGRDIRRQGKPERSELHTHTRTHARTHAHEHTNTHTHARTHALTHTKLNTDKHTPHDWVVELKGNQQDMSVKAFVTLVAAVSFICSSGKCI